MPEKKVHRIKLLSEYLDIDKKNLERYLYKVDKLFNLEDLFNNSKNINLSILDFHPEFIKNSNGYRGGQEERSCIYCGKINQNDKYIKRYGCCRKCLNTIYIKDFEKISNNLLKRSRANARNRNHDYKHTITKDYIKDIYISQECKCAYSGHVILSSNTFILNEYPFIVKFSINILSFKSFIIKPILSICFIFIKPENSSLEK